MKHIWPFAALFVFSVGCVADSGDDLGDLLPDDGGQDGGGNVDGGGGGDEAAVQGCDVGVRFESEHHRLARGGVLDLEIEDGAQLARPRVVRSSAPEILNVAQTGAGTTIKGIAPGTANIEVWRCDRRIASYPVTVAPVADVEISLSYGAAGRSEPLSALVGIAPGGVDQLEITYFDDQHVPLAGRGAIELQLEGGIRRGPAINLALFDHADGTPRELAPIEIAGAGRITATAGAHEVVVDVTTTPAPAALALELVELPVAGGYALEVLGETASGHPIAGLAPTFTVSPADAFTQLPTEPRTSQLLLVGQPHGPVTFTATVAGVTKTLTVTFP